MSVPISIVVPAYREEERLPASLERLLGYLDEVEGGDRWEVIVVDDGSPDGTARAAERFAPRIQTISYRPNRGKGFAVRQGVLASKGDLVLFSDADFSTPIEEWKKLEAARPEGGIAFGSRAVDEELIGVFQPIHRRLMGKTFNKMVQAVATGGIRDTQCGFKLFDGPVARRLFAAAKIDRFAFDVEILFLARRNDIPVVEIPVVWNNVEGSRVRVVIDSANMAFDLMRIRWLHRKTGGRLPEDSAAEES